MTLFFGVWMMLLLFSGIYVLIDAALNSHKRLCILMTLHVLVCYMSLQQMIKVAQNGPVLFAAILPLVVISIVTAVVIIIMFIWRSRNVSLISIKEGLDMLSDGLCYYYRDGRVKFVNPAMNVIARDLIGHSVTDGRALWDAVSEKKNHIVHLGDGSVYRFVRSEKDFLDEPVIELVASDITDEYALSKKLQVRKTYLEGQRRRLLEVNDSITDLTIEKEILQTKINIHDDLGKTLVAIRSHLAGRLSKEELFAMFDTGLSLMASPPEGFGKRDDYAAVLKAADDVGIKVIISGQLPADPDNTYIVAAAMSECITNTFRHAEGDELCVDISKNEHDETIVRFTNNGKPPAGEIKETGGLGHLRHIAEQRGADMKVVSTPEFVLEITLLGQR